MSEVSLYPYILTSLYEPVISSHDCVLFLSHICQKTGVKSIWPEINIGISGLSDLIKGDPALSVTQH